jgi:hypothetical protein
LEKGRDGERRGSMPILPSTLGSEALISIRAGAVERKGTISCHGAHTAAAIRRAEGAATLGRAPAEQDDAGDEFRSDLFSANAGQARDVTTSGSLEPMLAIGHGVSQRRKQGAFGDDR